MHHPDLTQQLAGERQARYRAQATTRRLTRPDRSAGRRASRSGSDPRPGDPIIATNPAAGRQTRAPSFGYVIARIDQPYSEKLVR